MRLVFQCERCQKQLGYLETPNPNVGKRLNVLDMAILCTTCYEELANNQNERCACCD